MTLRLYLTPRTQRDLEEIWDFSARNWSPAQAEIYLRGMNDVFNLLCSQPDLARRRAEFTPPIRLYVYRSHLIAYDNDGEALRVIRVLHTSANWAAILQD